MLTYDYVCKTQECSKKDEVIEVRKKITDPDPQCPECGVVLSRHFSAGNNNKIQLKGDGWFGSKHAIK